MCLPEVPAGAGKTDKTMHRGRVVTRERSVGSSRDAVVVGQLLQLFCCLAGDDGEGLGLEEWRKR